MPDEPLTFPLEFPDNQPLTVGAEYRSGRKVQGAEVGATKAKLLRYANDLLLHLDGWIAGDAAPGTRRPGYGYLCMSIAQARSLRDALSAALEAQP